MAAGDPGGTPVVFVHGNLSAATWWEETMARMPEGTFCVAMDLRAYGEADPTAKVDATRGMRDFSDDIAALMREMGIAAAHMVGHSLGGAVLWQFLSDYPGMTLSLTQVAPGSPYGFGACRPDGTPCFPDNAGSGGGAVNTDLIALMQAGDRGDETPNHMRNVLNTYVWKPPFVPERIEDILTSALAQHVGDEDYPGDFRGSDNWPGVAPGKLGPINAMAPIHQSDPLGFTKTGARAPILWIRGADDPVVADGSLFDLGTLGSLGAVPGWPGAEVFPPQPMIVQTERALKAYEAAGGTVERVVFDDCGHSPYLEKPAAFDEAFHGFLACYG
nr:alpha/beta hydrolase [Maritimibacter sp. DP1N21-5]